MAKSGVRRTVIREWMSLARDKRQSEEHAVAFARKAAQSHPVPRSRRDPCSVILGWLLPRTGRP